MKKLLVILLSALMVCGVGYLGFVIFRSKNIVNVEIVGSMQTLYVIDEELDFEDAQLKVTYRNGDVKLVKLDKKRVDVTSFSTSLQTHGTMKIVYKSAVLEVEYDVINKGLYYVEETVNKTPGNNQSPTYYSKTNTPMLFYIKEDGQLEHYYKSGAKYAMHDGAYDTSYKYQIYGDTLNVYLGTEEVSYKLKADYNDQEGTTALKSVTERTDNNGLVEYRLERSYAYYKNFKTDRTIKTVQVDLSYANPTTYGGEQYITFTKGDTIESSGKEIYLIVTFANPLSSYMSLVYVHVTDGMVTRNSLNTSQVTDLAHMICRYEGEDFEINYRVKNG